MKMISKLPLTLILASLLGLTGAACGRNPSPAQTDAAVASAQMSADKNVADARRDATNDTVDAQKDLNKANSKYAHESAQANRDIALAQADATYKVSVEKCQSVTGDARTACTKQAEATVAAQKADANSVARAADPTP